MPAGGAPLIASNLLIVEAAGPDNTLNIDPYQEVFQ